MHRGPKGKTKALNMIRAGLLALFLALLLPPAALAQHPPIAGLDYRVLNDIPEVNEAPATIEVIEFFWYRCPHCYDLEPALEAWLARLPADVRFKRIPVVFGSEWAVDARVFYALESIGELDRLHRPLLNAIHESKGRMLKGGAYVRWVSAWIVGQGIDRNRLEAALNSARVDIQVRRAGRLTDAYGVSGTPNLAVNGRYVIRPAAGDRRRILVVTDHLIRQARDTQVEGRRP
jgi:protein dithiol oxidoreductase (disulfide-forming)